VAGRRTQFAHTLGALSAALVPLVVLVVEELLEQVLEHELELCHVEQKQQHAVELDFCVMLEEKKKNEERRKKNEEERAPVSVITSRSFLFVVV
jgi:hypothetical protein